jgi:ABC-type sugar transport system substrate-binding protein
VAKKLKLYAITHDILGDVFWDIFRKGLRDAANRYEVEVEHLRPGKFSPELQASLIEAAASAKPDGIISTIPDVAAVEGPLRSAINQGIPVICINAKDDRREAIRNGRILATIDSQQYLQGYLSVEWMWLYLNCGFTLSKDIYTGPVIVDSSNVKSAAEGVARGFR